MTSLHVSRRAFLRGALAASSLVVAGLSLRALTMGGQRPTPGGRAPTNVRVSHDGYHRHGEPCLAVNPRDPSNLLAACMAPGTLNTYASFDGGRTWRSNGPLSVPAGSTDSNDVSASFNDAGRGFVCGSVLYGSDDSQRGVRVWRTEDGGRTFQASVGVTEGVPEDHPSLAAERWGQRALHVVWSAEGLSAVGYARSIDEGLTFEAPRSIVRVTGATLGVTTVACGPPAGVYAIYAVYSGRLTGHPPPDTPGTVAVVCSQDHGNTFDPPIELGQSTIGTSFPGLTATSASLPAIAADPHSGLVCAAFTVHQAGVGHADILLAASRDGGRTWSPATAVTPPDQVIYFQPQVAIDYAGRIGVMAFGMAHGVVSVVLIVSEPGSLRFGSPITVTDQPFDPTKGGPWIGDYQALAATPDAFHPLWNDTRTGQLEVFTASVRR